MTVYCMHYTMLLCAVYVLRTDLCMRVPYKVVICEGRFPGLYYHPLVTHEPWLQRMLLNIALHKFNPVIVHLESTLSVIMIVIN